MARKVYGVRVNIKGSTGTKYPMDRYRISDFSLDGSYIPFYKHASCGLTTLGCRGRETQKKMRISIKQRTPPVSGIFRCLRIFSFE